MKSKQDGIGHGMLKVVTPEESYMRICGDQRLPNYLGHWVKEIKLARKVYTWSLLLKIFQEYFYVTMGVVNLTKK